MRRKGPQTFAIRIDAPCRGLITRLPADLADEQAKRAMSFASNMRFDDGVMRNAPGHEIGQVFPLLESIPNLIFQAHISGEEGFDNSPIVGNESQLLAVSRQRNQPPVVDAGPTATVNPFVDPDLLMQASVSDPDSGPEALTYKWVQIAGPADVEFSSDTVLNPTATFPEVQGTYELKLTAFDGAAFASDIATFRTIAPIAPTAIDIAAIFAPGDPEWNGEDANAAIVPGAFDREHQTEVPETFIIQAHAASEGSFDSASATSGESQLTIRNDGGTPVNVELLWNLTMSANTDGTGLCSTSAVLAGIYNEVVSPIIAETHYTPFSLDDTGNHTWTLQPGEAVTFIVGTVVIADSNVTTAYAHATISFALVISLTP